jgi:hypothetical protein
MTTQEATNGKTLQLAVWGGLAGAAVAVICVFFLPAAQIILGLCAVALVIAVLFFWNSVRTLGGDTDIPDAPPNQAEHGGGELEAKALKKKMLLLSLKDLENEKRLGKINDDDYEDVAQRYRDEVKALMKEMDAAAAPYRGKAEELLRAHLASKGLKGERAEKAEKNVDDDDSKSDVDEAKADEAAKTIVDEPRTEPADTVEEPAIPTKKSRDHDSSKGEAARAKCSKCGESNEPDAKFCKACATPMAAKKDEAKSEAKSETKEKEEGGADA